MKKVKLFVLTALVLAALVGFNVSKDAQQADPGGGRPGDTTFFGV